MLAKENSNQMNDKEDLTQIKEEKYLLKSFGYLALIFFGVILFNFLVFNVIADFKRTPSFLDSLKSAPLVALFYLVISALKEFTVDQFGKVEVRNREPFFFRTCETAFAIWLIISLISMGILFYIYRIKH